MDISAYLIVTNTMGDPSSTEKLTRGAPSCEGEYLIVGNGKRIKLTVPRV